MDHNLLSKVTGVELAPCSGALTYLNLGHNQLHTLEGLDCLSHLVELNLEGNRLEQVPSLVRCQMVVSRN